MECTGGAIRKDDEYISRTFFCRQLQTDASLVSAFFEGASLSTRGSDVDGVGSSWPPSSSLPSSPAAPASHIIGLNKPSDRISKPFAANSASTSLGSSRDNNAGES